MRLVATLALALAATIASAHSGGLGSTRRCRGFHVDHKFALNCGGEDDPSNMQWLPAEENLAKGARRPWDPPRQ